MGISKDAEVEEIDISLDDDEEEEAANKDAEPSSSTEEGAEGEAEPSAEENPEED